LVLEQKKIFPNSFGLRQKYVSPNILFVNYVCVVGQVATQLGELCGYFNENQIYQYGDLKTFFSLLVPRKLKNHFFLKIFNF
jgi:hypothetical protein